MNVCAVCGAPVTPRNRYGICSRTPACRQAYQQAWKQEHESYFRDRYIPEERPACASCGAPTSAKTGICTKTPKCRQLGSEKRERTPERVAWRRERDQDRRQRYRKLKDLKSATQLDMCALCSEFMPPDDRVMDHDHACCPGQSIHACGNCYRGVLHSACNFLLGWARDDPERLMQALRYLTDWQSSRPVEERAISGTR